jgi:hypothetical protein
MSVCWSRIIMNNEYTTIEIKSFGDMAYQIYYLQRYIKKLPIEEQHKNDINRKLEDISRSNFELRDKLKIQVSEFIR